MWQPPERSSTSCRSSLADGGGGRAVAPVLADRARAAHRPHPHLGAGDGAVARDRGRLRHADVIDWYGRFAEGRPGVLVVEATGIRDVPSGPLLRIGHDRFVDGPARAGRRGARGLGRRDAALHPAHRLPRDPAPAAARQVLRALPRDHRAHREALRGRLATPPSGSPTEAEVRDAPRRARRRRRCPTCSPRASSRSSSAAIASASPTCTCRTSASCRRCCRACSPTPPARALRAGFDGVELHYAHAYTMASFLSALNTRDDGYGGTREHRVRLPLEVIAAVRARVAARHRARLPLPRRRRHRGRQPRRRRRVVRRRARARRHRLPLDLEGRQVRGREAAEGRRGGLSVHRPRPATSACRRSTPTRAARSGATSPLAGADPRGGPRGRARRRRSSAPAASASSRRPKPCSRAARPTSSRRRASRSPIPTGS